MNIEQLIEDMRSWGLKNGKLNLASTCTVRETINNLCASVDDIADAFDDMDVEDEVNAIGECALELILLAEVLGHSFEECLLSAYEHYKKQN
jgi:hypothetical protein